MKPLIEFKRAIALSLNLPLLIYIALSQSARAVSPAPDGAYGPPAYGAGNTAEGQSALFSLMTGQYNTANGWNSLYHVTSGSYNTAFGAATLFNNTGSENAAFGSAALLNNTSGNNNTAIGVGAGINQTNGSGNVYIGQGMGGVAGENNQTYIANVANTPIAGTFVAIDNGVLGIVTSEMFSHRYEDVTPMNDASEALYRLKPVTYRYKKEIDPTQSPAFGLIAEEVAEANPALVAHNAKGQPESVHYEMVNAMLLNEFLKEQRKTKEQQATIADLKSTVASRQKQIEVFAARLKEQAAQIQKVSTKVQVSKAVLKMISNNH